MILAFYLSMPNCASWDGKWSGLGKKYVIVKTFRSKDAIEKAKKIRDVGYYHYTWSDGWAAGITVKEVRASQAATLRSSSEGFAGYDWMVDTICLYGAPMSSLEVQEFLKKQETEESQKPLSKRLDYSKYNGHTPAEKWEYRRLVDESGKSYSASYQVHVDLGPCMIWCPEGHVEQEANARLISDAPLLLEEVIRLQKQVAHALELLSDISGDSAFSGFGETTQGRIHKMIDDELVRQLEEQEQ